MATLVTPLSDGGRVEVEWAAGGDLKVQKYDANGAAVGARDVANPLYMSEPEVVPLAGGGFVIVTAFASKGGAIYTGFVYDTGGARVATLDLPGGGHGYDIAASPDGGFLVVSMEKAPVPPNGGQPDTTFQPLLTLYDNAGQVVRGPVELSGELPAITVQADGDYLVQWNDGGIARTLEIDPANPPALAKPAAPTLTLLDDQGRNQGPIGDWSTDPTPIARVAVSEVGTVVVTRYDGGGAYEKAPDGGVQVTAADVARGYIDIAVPGAAYDGMPSTWYARFKSADGVVSDPAQDSFNFLLRPEIWSVSDDAGAQTGELASGATTDDATPTVQIGLESSGLTEGQTLYVRDGSTIVGQTVLTAGDVARGYASITTSTLANGEHSLQAHNGGPMPAFQLTVAANAAAPADGTPAVGSYGNSRVQESALPEGSSPYAPNTTRSGSITLSSPDGYAAIKVGGQTVFSSGAFTPTVVTTVMGQELRVTGFDAASGVLSFTYQLVRPTGHHYQADGGVLSADITDVTATDPDGDSATGYIRVDILDDRPVAVGDGDTAAPGETATGNVITDASAGDAGDMDGGADRPGADGGLYVSGLVTNGEGGSAPDGAGGFRAESSLGILHMARDGSYAFTPKSDAAEGAVARFNYTIKDADGTPADGQLAIVIQAPSGGGSTSGQVLTSDQYGDTLQGGSGADTLIAGQGPDQLTGGGGADVFVFRDTPWNAGRVTDFAVGTDRLDLSALFQASGYSGSDPVADGYIRLQAEGTGRTVYYDTDGAASGNTIWFKITTLQGVGAGATWAQLGGETAPPPPPPPPADEDGEVIVSQRYGDTLQGGAGADTLLAGRGPDQLTGGEGADVFVYRETAWNAGVVTDFALGSDRLDLSELLADSGYAGSDPVADGWVRFEQTSGGAKVLVDTDGPAAGNTIWFQMTTLQGVSASGLTWAQLSGGGAEEPPPPPPPEQGQVLTSDQYGDTLQGGAGNDTLNAGQGPDQLTGAGGGDRFVFGDFPWNAGRITDFTPGIDKLDLSALFDRAGYSGADPIADHRLEFRADGGGNTQVYVDRDDPNGGDWPFLVTTLTGVSPGQIGPGDWIA